MKYKVQKCGNAWCAEIPHEFATGLKLLAGDKVFVEFNEERGTHRTIHQHQNSLAVKVPKRITAKYKFRQGKAVEVEMWMSMELCRKTSKRLEAEFAQK